MTKIKPDTADFQRDCSAFVQREVICCLSGIVQTLAGANGYTLAEPLDELRTLCEEAFELLTPIDDYEEAAIQEGWDKTEMDVLFGRDGHDTVRRECYYNKAKSEHAEVDPLHDDWRALCEEKNIEPYQREVFEHWAVSNYLAEKLTAHGEKVGDFDFFKVWARTTTGQAISIDGVIETIVREMMESKT